jgi:hypothetical protein
MPTSCRAVSLLTLFVGSQSCEPSRTLCFCDSFDPRDFMVSSILCRLYPGDLDSDFEVGWSGAALI